MTARSAFLPLALLTLAQPGRAEAPPTADDVQDVVFFHDDQPLFLRLRVRLGGQAYQAVWRQAMAHLFQFLDGDRDGAVTPQELNRGGWLERMRSESAPGANRRGAKPAPAPSTPLNLPTVRTPEALARAVRPFFGPLALQSLPNVNDGSEKLFERLDDNRDGKLSQPELDAAASALSSYDEDDDEMIRASELRGFRNPLFNEALPQPGPADAATASLVLVIAKEPRAQLVSRLIKRYDVGSRENPREKDHKLARFELGLDDRAFRTADADADGALDADELSHFLDQPAPSLEITVHVGTGKNAKTTIAPSAPRSPTSFLTRGLRRPASGRFDLLDDHIQVEFSPRSLRNRPDFDLRQFYELRFAAADANGDKTLDKKESERDGFFRDTLAVMDQSGDGTLTEVEMLAFVDQQVELGQSRVCLTIGDQGRALFDALDANRDRSLGARELRTATRRLSAWDLDADGQLSEDEVPRHIRLTFDRTEAALLIRLGIDPFNNEPSRDESASDSPAWFTKMDVNRDGDLSPREWLGAPADFQRLDGDGDGLIDPSEALRAR